MNTIISINRQPAAARYEVASAVNAFIARAGVSKSAVARELGMAQSTFSRRTTGAEPFDVDELGSLADYFGVELTDLISGNITQMPPNAKKTPTPKSEGQTLPRLDSNQQPAGSQPAPETRATITRIRPNAITLTPPPAGNAVITKLHA